MDLAPFIDHTLLRPDATKGDIAKLCEEAIKYHFCSVCVNPRWVRICSDRLIGKQVKTCAVVGFPLGATLAIAKRKEAELCAEQEADEIDMVINIGDIKDRNYKRTQYEISMVRQAINNKVLKIIIETCLLTDQEKEIVCKIAKESGADFVKTSTGFSKDGATVKDVALMRRIVGSDMGVKASGGIRDYEAAKAMIEAGANRLGTSAGVKIVNEAITINCTSQN